MRNSSHLNETDNTCVKSTLAADGRSGKSHGDRANSRMERRNNETWKEDKQESESESERNIEIELNTTTRQTEAQDRGKHTCTTEIASGSLIRLVVDMVLPSVACCSLIGVLFVASTVCESTVVV